LTQQKQITNLKNNTLWKFYHPVKKQ